MKNGNLMAFVIAMLILVMAVKPAYAQWSAQVTGPDVFGNTTVLASVDDAAGQSLVVQCDQNDTLDLAYLIPGTPSEMDDASKAGVGIPADLLVKVDDAQVMKFSAQLRAWNNTYLAVVASGRTTAIVAAIKAIGRASSQISVGAEILGNQQTDTFDASNSTSSMNTATTECKLSSITAGPSSAVSSSQ